jgi:hypothetical protein
VPHSNRERLNHRPFAYATTIDLGSPRPTERDAHASKVIAIAAHSVRMMGDAPVILCLGFIDPSDQWCLQSAANASPALRRASKS